MKYRRMQATQWVSVEDDVHRNQGRKDGTFEWKYVSVNIRVYTVGDLLCRLCRQISHFQNRRNFDERPKVLAPTVQYMAYSIWEHRKFVTSSESRLQNIY